MKQVIYNASTHAVTTVEIADGPVAEEEMAAVHIPTIEERVATVEEAALDLAELQSEMLYQLCLMEMGVTEDDL